MMKSPMLHLIHHFDGYNESIKFKINC